MNPFRPFSIWLRPHRKHVAFGLLLLMVAQAMGATIPMLLKWAIDAGREGMAAANSLPAGLDPGVGREMGRYALIIAGLAVLQWVANFGMRWYLNAMSRRVERDLRSAYVEHLITLPLAFFHERRVGDLMARATNDVEAIQRFMNHAFRMAFTAVLNFAISLTLMCTIDWRLALLSLIPVPVTVLLASLVAGSIRDGYREVQEQFGNMVARIQENLSGIRVVKSYARGPYEIDRFIGLNDRYVAHNRHLINIRSIFYPLMFLFNGASMVIILWLGGLRVIEGTITLGAFVAFNVYVTRMGRPMMMLGRIVDEYNRALASLNRITAIINEKHQDRGPVSGDGIRGEIEFRNVSVSYEGRPALQDVSIKIPAGSTLAVVGRVGSGKTTLARLIPRLMPPDEGEILIEGTPISDLPLHELRQAVGYVPQDTFLFSTTIRENVAMGADATLAGAFSTNGGVEKAVAVSQLEPDLETLPQGLETIVGERGVTLSGGQKQRTALSRAVIRHPRILILDDSLASVDTSTEDEILKRLRSFMAARTTIIIAHRISTVMRADRIVVLDDGRVVEEGTHDDLVQADGIYADMFRRQHLREELEEL
jgi:ATP-binding cassette subfamily B multidrug efflux pump